MIDCKESALRLLSFKDRTEEEMRRKLKEKSYTENEVEDVIAFLKEYGYINDRRYAERFSSDAKKIKKWGRRRIEAELLSRGIPREIIDEVTKENEEDEKEIILDEIKRRFKNADFSNRKERARIFSYFARRGFSTEKIYGAINLVCSFEDIETNYVD